MSSRLRRAGELVVGFIAAGWGSVRRLGTVSSKLNVAGEILLGWFSVG